MITSAFSVTDHSSGASAPRQHATKLALGLGFSEARAGQVAIVVSELATNIAKHSHGGHILMHAFGRETDCGIEILAIDRGPGVPVDAIRDGYSTAGSLGTGLGAIQRQADEFEIYSQPGTGAVMVARLWRGDVDRASRLRICGISVPKSGETVCGDAWAYHDDARRRVFIVVDGLGHGPNAAAAAQAAISVFNDRYTLAPADLIEEIHLALRATRGAAVAVASIDRERDVLRFAGVGNTIASLVVPDQSRHSLASHNGTAGHAMRHIQEFTYPVRPHAVLVMHSDGLGTQWNPHAYTGLWSRDPALAAGALYRDFTRGRDDSTVFVAHIG
jgi:anti-sigma regulatory factor (Ser/Thr protein kinase)